MKCSVMLTLVGGLPTLRRGRAVRRGRAASVRRGRAVEQVEPCAVPCAVVEPCREQVEQVEPSSRTAYPAPSSRQRAPYCLLRRLDGSTARPLLPTLRRGRAVPRAGSSRSKTGHRKPFIYMAQQRSRKVDYPQVIHKVAHPRGC